MEETLLFQHMVRFRNTPHLQKVRDLDDIHRKEVPHLKTGCTGQYKSNLPKEIWGKKVAELFSLEKKSTWKPSQVKNFDLSQKKWKTTHSKILMDEHMLFSLKRALFLFDGATSRHSISHGAVCFCEPKMPSSFGWNKEVWHMEHVYMLIERGALSIFGESNT